MRQIPASIQIGPFRFKVEATLEAIIRERAEDGDTHLRGQLHYQKLCITVDPTMAPDALARTLLHEVLHGVWYATGQDTNKSEEIVGPLAPQLLDTLRRNPELVAYLMEAQEE